MVPTCAGEVSVSCMWELWGLYSRQAPLDLDYSTVGSNVMLIPTASMKSGTFKLTRETRQRQLITVDKGQGMARWLRYQLLLQTIWLGVEHLHGGSQLSELSSSENLKPLLASMSTRHDTHTHIQNTQITSKEKKKRESCLVVYLALSPSGAMLCPIFCDSIFTVIWQNLPTINKMFKG